MRKVFSDYALFVLALVAGTFGVGLFMSLIFNESNSLNLILENWISHLI